MPGATDDDKAPETVAAANGIADDSAFGAVAPPLYLSSTFAFEGFERPGRFDYSRTANPSRAVLADTLAKLEGGAGAVITASGLAALDLVLSRLESGQFLIAPHDCYAGTMRLLDARQERGGFSVEYVDQTDSEALHRLLRDFPTMVLVETPSNPLMRIVDIAAVAENARQAGATVVVDNTFSRLRSNVRSSLAQIMSFIRPPSTSTVIPMWWAARPSPRRRRTPNGFPGGQISRASSEPLSIPI